jgi:hypothetical protein
VERIAFCPFCLSSIENCIKMCFLFFRIQCRSTDEKNETSVLLLMSIDNLMDLFSVYLSTQRGEVSKHTQHRAPNNGHFFPFQIDQSILVCRVQIRRNTLVQKSGRIKRNKLLRIIQICYRKLHFEADFFVFGLQKAAEG